MFTSVRFLQTVFMFLKNKMNFLRIVRCFTTSRIMINTKLPASQTILELNEENVNKIKKEKIDYMKEQLTMQTPTKPSKDTSVEETKPETIFMDDICIKINDRED